MSDYDVLVIGSGFGGSVAALRLSEKGYRVCVVEAGARFRDEDFPKTSWRINRFLFAPRLGLKGIQRIHKLPDAFILAGAGVGGGSLVYANTLYQPDDEYFQDPLWSEITDWKAELEPWYQVARKMLGVEVNPFFSPSDQAMKLVADQMGVGSTFKMAPLGIYFGDKPGVEHKDPYFGGDGPKRVSCKNCGECMTGCRHNSKNTLVKNYLYFAEKNGVEIRPLTTVTKLEFKDGQWKILTRKSTSWMPIYKTVTAKEVVVAAGAFNTQKLLHRMKISKYLNLSDALGKFSRTNSEALVGTIMPKVDIDFSQGAAITSSFFPNKNTHVEPVRYGKGSNLMGLLQTVLTSSNSGLARAKQFFAATIRRPDHLLRFLNVRRWSERSVIGLVMQNLNNSITVFPKRSVFGTFLSSKNDANTPNPVWIPEANEVVERLAKNYNGYPAGNIGNLIGAPFTAHFIGGCIIGSSRESGVIDPYHRVWGYPTLHVVDGSSITANLGVNPSLTITAQAERAFSLWPNKGEVDERPTQGEPYKLISPIRPQSKMRL